MQFVGKSLGVSLLIGILSAISLVIFQENDTSVISFIGIIAIQLLIGQVFLRSIFPNVPNTDLLHKFSTVIVLGFFHWFTVSQFIRFADRLDGLTLTLSTTTLGAINFLLIALLFHVIWGVKISKQYMVKGLLLGGLAGFLSYWTAFAGAFFAAYFITGILPWHLIMTPMLISQNKTYKKRDNFVGRLVPTLLVLMTLCFLAVFYFKLKYSFVMFDVFNY